MVPAYLQTKFHLDPSSRLATTDMGQKNGASVPLFQGSAGSPSNTMWPGPRPISMPSFILIHPTVWRQYTNVTDRQDRTGQNRQRSDSIGRTVLQTVAQKLKLNQQLAVRTAPIIPCMCECVQLTCTQHNLTTNFSRSRDMIRPPNLK